MASWTLRTAGLPPVRVERPRIKSFLTTLFGDVVSVHGGAVDLSGLIAVGMQFGATERNVRTAVLRMVREGWLVGERSGRAAYYRLSQDGHERFEAAQSRIYSPGPGDFPNHWQIILAPGLTAAQRYVLQREMGWLGFVNVGGRTMVHIGNERDKAVRILREVGLRDLVFVFDGICNDMDDPGQCDLLRRFAWTGWDLRGVARRYAKFLSAFTPAWEALAAGGRPSAEDALALRILLIHEYRRALLHDPGLPPTLLPDDWAGDKARELCADLYRKVAAASLPALRRAFTAPEGAPLPAADARFGARFRPSVRAQAGRSARQAGRRAA